MAHFDKAIPPGGQGKIKLQVNTKGYQGSVEKSARVTTNDPEKQSFVLRVRAFIKVPITVTNPYVFFYGKQGEVMTRVVEVKAELDQPLVLTPAEFDLSDKVDYAIEEVEKGRKFTIRFMTKPDVPDTFQGTLKLKTNYSEKSELVITIRAKITKPT